MSVKHQSEKHPVRVSNNTYDVLIVGAGFAGLYALYRLRALGFHTLLLEAGAGVGGTWYWNRYPGARVDIESLEYSYSFSDELQQEWKWSERYASQAELLKYLNHVADRFDLHRSIQFNTRVSEARFDDAADRWTLTTPGAASLSARFCVLATGFLSAPNQPQFAGMEKFQGRQLHTAYWPEDGIDFSGQRVAVIGTGSSAIQTIPFIAKQAKHLTVFQRTPAFAVPLRNCPMPPEYERRVKADYREWRRREREESFGGWISVNFAPIDLVTESALKVPEQDRLALYEDRWKSGGLAFYNVYPDIFFNRQANDTLADFLRRKIRERVNDPAVAELLTPKNYPVLTKRLCADGGYYETFNRENVLLVDVQGADIEITAAGTQVKQVHYEFDSIVYATGFDALTGAISRIKIRGREGRLLSDHWRHGARTAYGLMSAGFPNLFILDGPGSPCPLFQPVLLVEEQVDWIGEWISHMKRESLTRMEPTAQVEQDWVDHCTQAINATLFPLAASWYMGANVPGKTPIGLCDFGGILNYRRKCADVAKNGYRDFLLSSRAAASVT